MTTDLLTAATALESWLKDNHRHYFKITNRRIDIDGFTLFFETETQAFSIADMVDSKTRYIVVDVNTIDPSVSFRPPRS